MNEQSRREQSIIDNYHAQQQKSDRELELLQKKQRSLAEKEESIFMFKQQVAALVAEEKELHSSADEMREIWGLEEELHENFKDVERDCENQHEALQIETKQLYDKEELRTEQYYKAIQSVNEEER